jgi:hypothetical protein
MNAKDRLNVDIAMYKDALVNMAIVTVFYFLCWAGFLGFGGAYIEANCLFKEDIWLISTVFGVQLLIVSLFRCFSLSTRSTLMSIATSILFIIFGVGIGAWGFNLMMAVFIFVLIFFNGTIKFIRNPGVVIILAILCFLFFMGRDLTEPLKRPTYTNRMTSKELYGNIPHMNWVVRISNSESCMTKEEKDFRGLRADAVKFGYSETAKMNEEAKRKGLKIRYSFIESEDSVFVYDVPKNIAISVGDSERAISADRLAKGLGRY